MLVLFILVLAVVVLTDYRGLKQTASRGRIVAVYTTLLAASLIVGTLLIMEKRPVSPAEIIEAVIKSLGVVK